MAPGSGSEAASPTTAPRMTAFVPLINSFRLLVNSFLRKIYDGSMLMTSNDGFVLLHPGFGRIQGRELAGGRLAWLYG